MGRKRTSLRLKRTEWPRVGVRTPALLEVTSAHTRYKPSIVGGQQTLNLVERGASTLRCQAVAPIGLHFHWSCDIGNYYTFCVQWLRCRLNMVLPVYALGDSSLAPEGCAGSSGHRLAGREPRRSPHDRVDLWSLVELQSRGVCCDVTRGVAYP
ncbi:hypothetical protein GW17_00047066 [Ensete ventricosum]|nr:hypothetical protein GW17_00047066 [Ensete ventricosum]